MIGVLGTEELKSSNRLSLENKVSLGLPYFLDIALKNPFSPERIFYQKINSGEKSRIVLCNYYKPGFGAERLNKF